jgi:hypothetical protein
MLARQSTKSIQDGINNEGSTANSKSSAVLAEPQVCTPEIAAQFCQHGLSTKVCEYSVLKLRVYQKSELKGTRSPVCAHDPTELLYIWRLPG